jgi:hydroxymethylbilane synthase
MSEEIIIGSRASELAMVQSEHVASMLRLHHPTLTVRIEKRVASGDVILDKPLSEIEQKEGGGGLFTTELEHGLLNGDFHLAVHSLKDMPTNLPANLVLAEITEREDPRDALVVASRLRGECNSLATLPAGSVVGTSSLRRQAYIAKHYPSLKCMSIRGNLQTRMVRACLMTKNIYCKKTE